ncbi:hypothetical protein PQO03_11875 [Lentisphaera profundi]|uniref:Type II secretion system protein n=1 Tax=Lentisphaera profundi TaxID=1658616 RepID=A0ABY7VWR5_9BACT|nr:hypothetical protein [Lentisphaera profundi]WDE98537.1 hypothetical protein PQO03_11875 [Lentisphaera profundi]
MKRFFTRTDLLVIIASFCVLGILMAAVIPALGPRMHTLSDTKRCTNNLKQIGTAMIMYFSDGSETRMPSNTGHRYLQSSDPISRLFELEPEILSCPAKRKCPQYKKVYITPSAINSALFADIESPASRIAMDGDQFGDTQVHKSGEKLNALFGDGHVEALAP